MLELKKIAQVLSGLTIVEAANGPARFMRLKDLSDLRAGRQPNLATGETPLVARALTIEDGDIIVGARGTSTDVFTATPTVFGAFISLDLYLVRPNRAVVDPDYLAAFFQLPEAQAALCAGKQGSGLARLGKDALDDLGVPLPPMQKQKMIAGLADSFNQEARLLKQLAELNSIFSREALGRAVRVTDTDRNSIKDAK